MNHHPTYKLWQCRLQFLPSGGALSAEQPGVDTNLPSKEHIRSSSDSSNRLCVICTLSIVRKSSQDHQRL